MLSIPNNLENPEMGEREVPFSRELYIEREDVMENPPKKYFRLFPGNEVRLMGAYFVTCTGVEKDENGNVTVIHCTYDPETKSGSGFTLKSELQDRHDRICRAEAHGGKGLRQLPVYEKRLLLCRLQGQRGRKAGIQPYRFLKELLQASEIKIYGIDRTVKCTGGQASV